MPTGNPLSACDSIKAWLAGKRKNAPVLPDFARENLNLVSLGCLSCGCLTHPEVVEEVKDGRDPGPVIAFIFRDWGISVVRGAFVCNGLFMFVQKKVQIALKGPPLLL